MVQLIATLFLVEVCCFLDRQFGNLHGSFVLMLLALQMSMGARLGTKKVMDCISRAG